MSSKGFEFAYMLDGSNGTPVILDWPMVADAAGYVAGDALVADSAGRADKATSSTAAVAFICQETITTAVSADDLMKVAIVTHNQVWRCSMDATTTALIEIYDKDVQLVDENTVDADGTTSGCITLFDTSQLDDEGNVLAYVILTAQLGAHS